MAGASAEAQGQRVSIAMCTYNGARHLRAQLASFAQQTRLPDELVVCDDGSSDDSVAILREYAATAPFRVDVHVNADNLGYARNFARTASLTTGTLVFFADQDDVWHPTKLAAFLAAHRRSGGAGLLMCDARLTDAELRPLGRTWWQSRGFGRRAQRALQGTQAARVVLRNPVSVFAGATMAFERRFIDHVLPIPAEWSHDAWLVTVVSAYAPIALVPAPLNDYRQHGSQVFGATPSTARSLGHARTRGTSANHFLETVRRYELLLQRLMQQPQGLSPPDYADLVRTKILHWRRRAQMRQTGRGAATWLLAREAWSGRYWRYSQGWRSLAMDLVWGGRRVGD